MNVSTMSPHILSTMSPVQTHYFSLVSTVGTPQTIAAQELRIECLFPLDETTEAQHLELMAGH